MRVLERFRRTRPPKFQAAPTDEVEVASLPAEAEVELGVLLQFLVRTEGFALAFAEVNAKPFEHELIAIAVGRYRGGAIAVIDMANVGSGPGFGSRLNEAAQGADAVFLTGLDALVIPGGGEQPALAELDLARNRLVTGLGVPLVLWGPAFVLAEIPFKAPNLWSLAVDRFVFAADGHRARHGANDARVGFADTAADYPRERSRLEELLTEIGPDSRVDVRAELLARLGDIARMQSRYDDADVLLRDALGLYRTIGDRLGEAHTLLLLGRLASAAGERDVGSRRLLDSAALFREIGITKWAEIADGEALLLGSGD